VALARINPTAWRRKIIDVVDSTLDERYAFFFDKGQTRNRSQEADPMWKRISLRTKILLMVSILVLITVGGGLISIGYTFIIDRFFTQIIDTDVQALQAIQKLENALIMQKGYVTYFSQEGDPEWLEQLKKHHHAFEDWMKKARKWADTDKERAILNEMDSQYVRYVYSRDEVIKLYEAGKREEGFQLHQTVRRLLFQIIDLCNAYNQAYENKITTAREKVKDRAELIKALALIALASVVVLGSLLAYFLISHILEPIRQLALDTDGQTTSTKSVADEVEAISARFQDLIHDVDQTKTKLKWSREHLQQVEKWALVGKLAAGVAHSVRNPLTSVKMRLFSMERTLALTPDQKEDFEVISEEIRHIDTIVGNFLEFSRPPKLKMQKVSPSDSVDMAIQLLRHRLESYDVTVEVQRKGRLPEITADPDQLKEVLVNLVVNACDAMVDGGSITIIEEHQVDGNLGPVVVIKVSDNGPGVPDPIQEKLFQPFFSTKEEGTGLGLSIATRIVEEHGGWLDLQSKPGEGATFIITLPEKEVETWGQS
jgi:signal transduction histidine kinase